MWAEHAPLRLLAVATLVVLCALVTALMQSTATPQAHATVYSVEEGATPSGDAADQLGQAAVLEGDQSGQDKASGSPAAGDAAGAGAGAATGGEGGGGTAAPAPDNAGGEGGGQAAGQAASAEGSSDDSASGEKAETIEDEEVALSSGLGGGEPVASGGASGIIWLIVAGIVAVVAFFAVSMGRVNSSISKMRHAFRK